MSDFVLKDSGARTQFDSGCVRDVQGGKGRFDLLGTEGLIRLHLIMDELQKTFDEVGTEGLFRLSKWYEKGAQKYSDRNWTKGMPTGVCFNSGMRHLTKYAAGWKDEDHLAACAWNLFAMMEYETTHPQLQDLPRVMSDQNWEERFYTATQNQKHEKVLHRMIYPSKGTSSVHYTAAHLCMAMYMAGWKGVDLLALATFHVFRIMELEKRNHDFLDMACQLDDTDYSED